MHKTAQISLNIGEIKARKFKSCDKTSFYRHGKSGNAHVINYGGDALEKPNNEGYSSIFG